ncbi:uncharacterized protein [Zea mays]|jgi:hypothetical protein|uniref:uncharacterized protein n=1 Tax=Zea mays TaxID=4577 RepID=UPI0009AA1F71|nr:uncharacterized protein LOC109945307 [Zea mays]|eukprot:XP_020406738.1 uncharacterized protein LOC109945307 [Zea mays]
MADDAATTATAAAAKAAEECRLTAEAARIEQACLDKFKAAHEAIWAQATAVVNVKALIPVILDKVANTYTKWRGLFLTVLGKYALTHHILMDEVFLERPAWL